MAQIGDTLLVELVTPSTAASPGAARNADSTPTALLRRNGATVAAAAVTVTGVGTGRYTLSVLLDAAHGWVSGDKYALEASWTMEGTAGIVQAVAQGFVRPAPATAADVPSAAAIRQEMDSNSVDLDAILAYVDELESRLTAARAAKLDNLDAAISSRATPAQVWAYATRTLTQSAAEVEAAVSGGTLTIRRGDTWSASLTGLGSISGWTEIWLTAKSKDSDTDPNALLMLKKTVGLVRLNRAEATAAQGSITVDDADAGDITITVAAAATAQLPELRAGLYDVQWKDASGAIHTLTAGTLVVTADVTRATS